MPAGGARRPAASRGPIPGARGRADVPGRLAAPLRPLARVAAFGPFGAGLARSSRLATPAATQSRPSRDVYARSRPRQRMRWLSRRGHRSARFFIRHDFPRRATGRVIQNGSFRAYTTVGTGLVLSVYIFLSCIQIVVIGKRRPDLWITTYTSDRSRTCVYGNHRDGVLAGGDDSAIGMRAGEVYLQLVPYTSPSQPQGTHTESAYFSTAAGVVIHIERISPPPSQPFPNVIRKISEFILI